MANRGTVGAMLLMLMAGCSSAKHISVPRHETTPVTGIVLVDGEPAAALTVECHPSTGSETIKHPVIAMTDMEGNFAFGMYEAGDGLPEGTYNLAFVWDANMVQKDKLNRAYADPNKTGYKVTVVAGESNDLGTIELSTKGK